MALQTIDGIDGLKACAGTTLPPSDWFTVDQTRVNAFADATLDHQWIHVDPERAQRESPWKSTIAHGYLTLSLLPHLLWSVVDVQNVSMAVNYGLNKVRFPSPVPVGSRVRLHMRFAQVEDIAGGVQVQMDMTMELEGANKPALAAEVVFRWYA
jgi:acyl dehydratase